MCNSKNDFGKIFGSDPEVSDGALKVIVQPQAPACSTGERVRMSPRAKTQTFSV